MEYLVSAESQHTGQPRPGYFPVTNDAYNEDVFKQNIEQYPQFQTAIDQLNDTKGEYAGALLSVFPEARQTVQTEIENTLNDKETPEEADAEDGGHDQRVHRGLQSAERIVF